jgi:hypothetical protein
VGAAICDGESVGSDEENRPSLVVQAGDPVSTGVVLARAGLNGVTAIWSIAVPEKDSPSNLRGSSCLRRRLTKAMVPTRRIKAATPPAIPPAIAPVYDVAFDDANDGDGDGDGDVALTVIWTTGALKK